MSSTLTPPPELESPPSAEVLGGLYRMTVGQYERLVESGALDGQPVELMSGLLVRKMGKKPPHVIAREALRDELLPLIPRGWRLAIEAPVRIPDFDEPEPDLAIVRGTREQYQDRHPGPGEIELLIEVAETSLARDRGAKQAAYARGGVPVYWIVNLIDGQLEVYTGPTPTGYRDRVVLTAGAHASVPIGDLEIGRIAVSAFLPRGTPSGGRAEDGA